jgi:hypothetical protein
VTSKQMSKRDVSSGSGALDIKRGHDIVRSRDGANSGRKNVRGRCAGVGSKFPPDVTQCRVCVRDGTEVDHTHTHIHTHTHQCDVILIRKLYTRWDGSVRYRTRCEVRVGGRIRCDARRGQCLNRVRVKSNIQGGAEVGSYLYRKWTEVLVQKL